MKLEAYKNILPEKPSLMKQYYFVYCRKSSEAEDRQMSSIDDQKRILQELAQKESLPVLKIFYESKSAKEPGRVEFNKLISFIYKRDDIKGILCWNLNRLSRNPIDSATLQWLLQKNNIQEIKTPYRTYTEQDSDFIMSIESAQANRFIRDLRRDTLRGLESKLDKGIFPGLAPVGYLNDQTKNQGERDVIPHPTYFPLMRKIFDLALTGRYSAIQLFRKADKLSIRSNRGNPISRTQIYRCLTNPFYTGRFEYKGKLYQGTHRRMLLDDEFDLIQDILAGRSKPRPHIVDREFLTGLLRCKTCGMAITAERHTKHYKNGKNQTFTYYRCTKKSKVIKCEQCYIAEKELKRQMCRFLGKIKISERFIQWAIKQINLMTDKENEYQKAKIKAAQENLSNAQVRLNNLFKTMMSPINSTGELLSNEEYRDKKREFIIEKQKAIDKLREVSKRQDDWGELAVKTFNFATLAQERFKKGTIAEKKYLMHFFGSNLLLNNGSLGVEPRGPFQLIEKVAKMEKLRLEPKKAYELSGKYSDLSRANYLGVAKRDRTANLPLHRGTL